MPLPSLKPTSESLRSTTTSKNPQLSWPAAGQAAVGIVGSPILDIHGVQTPAPTASTAKLITALTVLEQKPLGLDETGPTITLGPNDVALYNSYSARGGSVVPAVTGEQISEYQMLQTIMLPSANNMADSLAIWAFGSLKAYSAAANAYLTRNGLTQTRVGTDDASGFAPSTTSTAHDLVRLGELAMQNPALAQVVGQSTATNIPIVKNIKNVNSLLGTANIIGVKTGNTDQAGGVYVSASKTTVNNKPVTIVTALIGASTLSQALASSLPLVQSAQSNFKPVSVIKAGSVVGRYQLPWGGSVAAITSTDLTLNTWSGDTMPATTKLDPVSVNTSAGSTIGSISIAKSALSDQQSVSVKLQAMPPSPTIWWRLLRP
jgi:D-alanyl-D-alanine carboxypeptidase (penicillin-binding protein 5/6)